MTIVYITGCEVKDFSLIFEIKCLILTYYSTNDFTFKTIIDFHRFYYCATQKLQKDI